MQLYRRVSAHIAAAAREQHERQSETSNCNFYIDENKKLKCTILQFRITLSTLNDLPGEKKTLNFYLFKNRM
jgi:hypothetical protein